MADVDKVLIATYYWPPSGGAGVQRWLKLSKYLPEFGITPTIITVKENVATYPAIDESLLKEVPAHLRVIKTPTREWFHLYAKITGKNIPSAGFANEQKKTLLGECMNWLRGNLFIPDPRKPWNARWTKVAQTLIDKEGYRTIITSSPPHSTQLGGLRLKERNPHIKWIADLRDPWTEIYYYHRFKHSWLARKIDASYEKKVITNADVLLVVSESIRHSFLTKYPSVDPERITILPNGWDPSDFPEPVKVKTDRPYIQLEYIGTMSDDYPIDGLLNALKHLVRPFKIRFTGTMPAIRRAQIEDSFGEMVTFSNYLPHRDAVSRMCSADVLILIIPNHPDNKGILTGKLFEYLGSGKSILCIGPIDGDAANIVRACDGGGVFDYDDTVGIQDWLNRFDVSSKNINKASIGLERSTFSRRDQASELAELIIK